MSAYTNQRSLPSHGRKRVRFSGGNSSEPSISDEAALIPTSATDESTDASTFTSDTESALSESSEEPSDDSSSDEESDDADAEMQDQSARDGVVNLRANRGAKPVMKLDQEELGPDIRDFLKDFLPQLKAANEELEAQKRAGTLQSLDAGPEEDGEPYIEMDLGLGVLEAKDPNADSSEESDSGESDVEEGAKEKDVLGQLLGREKAKDPASIEVVQDSRAS